jgi:hypothetical protein
LIKDAWRAKSWKDKFRIWLMPTGWRPADVAEKYPVYKIEDVYNFEKYDTKTSTGLNVWSWVQLMMILLFVSYLFGNIAIINKLDSINIFTYAGFIFLSVYSLTELMDRNQYAIVWEILRSGLGIFFIYQQGDWFGASQKMQGTQYVLTGYFILSILVTTYFAIKHRKEDHQLSLSI